MNNKQAIKPDLFVNNFTFPKDQEALEKGASEDERSLYSLSRTVGWKILSEYIEEILTRLDYVNTQAIEKGASFEEIGKNTIIINQTKGIIEQIKNKVKDAVSECEEENGQ